MENAELKEVTEIKEMLDEAISYYNEIMVDGKKSACIPSRKALMNVKRACDQLRKNAIEKKKALPVRKRSSKEDA